jgi:hypothetical protein
MAVSVHHHLLVVLEGLKLLVGLTSVTAAPVADASAVEA